MLPCLSCLSGFQASSPVLDGATSAALEGDAALVAGAGGAASFAGCVVAVLATGVVGAA